MIRKTAIVLVLLGLAGLVSVHSEEEAKEVKPSCGSDCPDETQCDPQACPDKTQCDSKACPDETQCDSSGCPTAKTAEKPPAKPITIWAMVGDVKIGPEKVEKILEDAPKEMPVEYRNMAKRKALDSFVMSQMLQNYMDAQKTTCTDEDIAKMNEEIAAAAKENKMDVDEFMEKAGITDDAIKDAIRARKLAETVASDEKVEEFIKAHPNYFNGSKVHAKHILLACPAIASTEKQKTALEKMSEILADIKEGKIKFSDAAEKYSDCPSGKKAGGDLGEFSFTDMVPAFAVAAIDGKDGEITEVIRTPFGYHIIEVVEHKAGSEKPNEKAKEIAKMTLLKKLESDVLKTALTTSPIVIHEN